MKPESNIEPTCQKTANVLERLMGNARTFQIPDIYPQLEGYKEKLTINDYQVLVVGEAGRGKSSFVNALIGRSLINTDINSSTNQIFRIRHAEDETYRLRFVDGSTHEISATAIPSYDAKVTEDIQTDVSRMQKIIHWIEIDTPTCFLPSNISIIDTPGLNSLHTRITRSLIPLVDAIIFVLDSNQPILQHELHFIETILKTTSTILFVQTKIDKHQKDEWQKLKRRNEEILHANFAEHLPDVRIWPISNTHLLKANSTEDHYIDDDYLRYSYYKALEPALQSFLTETTGRKRASEAIQLAGKYHAFVRTLLEERLINLAKKDDTQRSIEVHQDIQQLGLTRNTHERTYSNFKESSHEIIKDAKRILRTHLQPGGIIERKELEKIDGIKSLEEAMQYNAQLRDSISNTTLEIWQKTHEQIEQHYQKLFAPFLNVAFSFYFSDDTSAKHLLNIKTTPLQIKSNWFALFKSSFDDTQPPLTLTGFASPQVATIITVSCILIRVLILYKNSLLEIAKKQLKEQLIDIIDLAYYYYFEVDPVFDEKSFVDEFFNRMEKRVALQMQITIDQVARDTQLELDRLTEEAQLDERQRRHKFDQLQEQIVIWKINGDEILHIEEELMLS